MNNKWHEIWEKRIVNNTIMQGDNKEIFLELKRLDGWDSTGNMLTYEEFYDQYNRIQNELEFDAKAGKNKINSIFEVGCGSGANLYLYQKGGIQVGGIDFSRTLISAAHDVLENPLELICDEAVNLPVDITYDAVLSNSVFHYFDNYEYAMKVLEKMYLKANYSIGIIDVHDLGRKDAFFEYRKSIDDNYEERYEALPKLFYDKSFFLKFAENHNMNIKFTVGDMENYWNKDFVFNCYMTKN